MKTRTEEIWNLRYFFGAVVVLTICAAIILFASDKTSIHLWINKHHNTFFDFFFHYYTHVGDGIFVAIGIAFIAMLNWKNTGWNPILFGGGLLITSGFLAQFLKRVFYPEALRPVLFLKEHQLHLIQGVEMHQHNSFPSGHTTAAFTFFGFLAFYYFTGRPLLQVLMAICAALVGYSRMYLSQHFFEDVFTGMLLGSACVLIVLILFPKTIRKKSLS